MRKRMGMLVLAAGLAACSNEEAAGGLMIEPKELDQDEQALVASMPVDVFQAYELNGPLPEDAVIKLVLEHYVNGEEMDPVLMAHFSGAEELNDALVSFAKSPDIEGNTVFVGGGPSGNVMTIMETGMNTGGATFGDFVTGEMVLQLEEPAYTGYYAMESGNRIDAGSFLTESNELALPAIQQFEHFYAMTVTITEEAP
ncbi:hypothetical protein [Planococcus lenghuensis]|uniref:Uncharacterized protein n=1 Tax=Planococcus lenghuensis TaxID=2213202 RepID=A0A1Q2KV87_9BACL|nr:hypothetical protein [Planococcus lenghuensis]AQQ52036.1 hypothetical protein B0X71_02130 [Planococcus lenghuensis]